MELDIEHLTAWHASASQLAPVLHDVGFHVASGELAAVLGPSGSGKTTLLRAIAGLHRTMQGTVALGGQRVDPLPPERRRIGLVPQDSALFPHLTVVENISFGLSRAARRGGRADDMLDLLGLTPLADRLPHQLSGGQAQRVAVARALAPAPRLVLLDEPFSALDAALRAEVRAGVRAALAETGTTALLVTHDQSEALSLATMLIVLADGRVRQAGPPRSIYARPADAWTGGFLGDANLFDAVSRGGSARTPLGSLRHDGPADAEVTVLVRPEQVRLGTDAGVAATVRTVHYFGHDSTLEAEIDGGGTVLVRVPASELPAIGERTLLRVDDSVRGFPRTAAS
ncbi:ABC transporter ATP-binding protein [Microbacterium sp. No. 7]|uniref:ABC transporter ATP-binding protein n=1 Tax=Microbacterium sp. No. 7 TaxID=1714373 RepID=UPI0006D1AAC6|nr:ABC transporter ATP-binding protein [Microbacterium sp. No. 7]ALJ21025.1 hypothetical protein AOA12_14405 [Microbacterium sp. No. 7]